MIMIIITLPENPTWQPFDSTWLYYLLNHYFSQSSLTLATSLKNFSKKHMFCGTPEAISDIQRFKLQTPLEAFANNWDVFLHPWSILWDAICFAAPVKPVPITFPPDTLFAEILQTYSLHWVVMFCFRGVLWHAWGHFSSSFPLTTSVLQCSTPEAFANILGVLSHPWSIL